jgi:hypothetical protein
VRRLLWLLALGGCDLVFKLDETPLEAPRDGDPDAFVQLDAMLDVPEICQGTLLCLRFEQNTFDGSPLHNVVTADGEIAFIDRAPGNSALVVKPETDTVIEKPKERLGTTLFNYSVEVFMDPTAKNEPNPNPDTGEALYRDDGNLTLIYTRATNAMTCRRGGLDISGLLLVPAAGWVHAACTFDGERLSLFYDGTLVACARISGQVGSASPIRVATNSGSGGGEHFLGAIDDVIVHASVLDPRDICARAGHDDCTGQVLCN